MAEFKTRLYDLRKQRDLTQYELAQSIGVNKQTVSQYERGVRRPDLETLSILCDYFNVSADYILGKADVTMRYVNSEELAQLDRKDALLLTDPEEKEIIHRYRAADDLDRAIVRRTLGMDERQKGDGQVGGSLVS